MFEREIWSLDLLPIHISICLNQVHGFGMSAINFSLWFFRILETEDVCPMCSAKVISENLRKITDVSKYLNPDIGDE